MRIATLPVGLGVVFINETAMNRQGGGCKHSLCVYKDLEIGIDCLNKIVFYFPLLFGIQFCLVNHSLHMSNIINCHLPQTVACKDTSLRKKLSCSSLIFLSQFLSQKTYKLIFKNCKSILSFWFRLVSQSQLHFSQIPLKLTLIFNIQHNLRPIHILPSYIDKNQDSTANQNGNVNKQTTWHYSIYRTRGE